VNRYLVTLRTEGMDDAHVEVSAMSASDAMFIAETARNENPSYKAKAKAVNVAAVVVLTCPTCGKPR